jgi:hypothetical protein
MVTNTLFPIIPPPEEVLYILGNGFDLSHGIMSRYADFEQWVKEQGNIRLIGLMDTFFSNKREFWCDIETALGEYDEEEIYEYCKPGKAIDYDHMMRSVAACEDAPDWLFKPVLDEFLKAFHDWVDCIDITKAKPKMTLYPESSYLTFNYTETLEHVYKIPTSQIKHVHGSRLNEEDSYIIGHNKLKSEDLHDTLNGELYFEQDTKNKIISWMNKLHKDTSSIIYCNQRFFQTLNIVKHVVVIGHSLYDVDWPYFDEVNKNIDPNAEWIFNHHTPMDRQRINLYVNHAGITNYKIQ